MPILQTKRLKLRPLAETGLSALHRFGIQQGARRCLWDNEIISIERVIAVTDNTPKQRSVNVTQRLGMAFRRRCEWHGWTPSSTKWSGMTSRAD